MQCALYPIVARFCSAGIQSCPFPVDEVCDRIVNHQLTDPQGNSNSQEFVREFVGRAVSGQFILSANTRDILVPLNLYEVYIISSLHPV